MKFAVQFQNQYPFHFHYGVEWEKFFRILFELGEYGAFSLTMNEKGKFIPWSYTRQDLSKRPEVLELHYDAATGQHTELFEFFYKGSGVVLKNGFSRSELKVFRNILENFQEAINLHLKNGFIEFREQALLEKFKLEVLPDIDHEIKYLKDALDQVFADGDFSVPERNTVPQSIATLIESCEKPSVYQQDDLPFTDLPPAKKTMLFCNDAGIFKNLTTGMLYPIVSENENFYRVLDDFLVEREFKKERFTKVETEVRP